MINSTSRYSQSTLATLIYENKDVSVIVPSQQTAYSFNFIWYQVTSLDRLDDLAYRFFLDPTQWWRIADANPEIMNWSVLPVGTIIRVPTL
jgi:hypothetical protein